MEHSKSHKINLSLLFIGLTLLIFLFGCRKAKTEDKTEKPFKVEVAYPEEKTVVLSENYPGNLVALRQVDIMARVDGVIKKIHVPSGGRVKEGQLLYSIEDSKYRDAVNQAKANLAIAESSHAYYTRQVESLKKAFQDQAVSEMELLQGISNLEQAAAQIENYSAALSNAQTMLGYCEIRAPFDGTISLQEFDEGAYVNGETTPVRINTIYNDDILHAYISIPEKRYLQLTENLSKENLNLDSVRITFSEPLSHDYFSKINYQAPEINPSTGTVTLRFNLVNSYGELKPGMYVNVEMPYGFSKHALIINDASIGTDQQGKYVYLVNDSNRVVYTPVEVGQLYEDTLRIVNKGIDSKSRYVVDALLKVRNGSHVEPYLKSDKR